MTPFFINITAGKNFYFFIFMFESLKKSYCNITMKQSGTAFFIAVVFLLHSSLMNARNIDVNLSPSNWWTGLNYNSITLVVSGQFSPPVNVILNHPGITVDKIYSGDNASYLFIDLSISKEAQAGIIPISFTDNKGNKGSVNFELQNRQKDIRGPINSEDIIYQIIPDRFCNGDPNNDKVKDYFEVNDRYNPIGIHGGDLIGISSNLDYIQQLGITCLDILPVIESNLMTMSYQRTGASDFYKIDKRLGDITSYQNLIQQCHNRGFKLIHNMVFHQIGKRHPWYTSRAHSNFFFGEESKYSSDINYILSDSYLSEHDKSTAYAEWQEANMPTVNQKNGLLNKILIQHCIWWLETSQCNALKIISIERNTPDFLSELFMAIKKDYPNLPILADSNSDHSKSNAFWQKLATDAGIESKNIHVSDYEMTHALSDAFSIFNEDDEGIFDLYASVSADFRFENPKENIVMADNHQLSRLFSNADKELDQSKMMIGYILTTRGIPSITYGTEWLLDGTINKGKGTVRKDFPGGWPNDIKNGFLKTGFSAEEKHFYNFTERLINWRNKNAQLFSGDFIHYAPKDGLYAYYRKKNDDAALIIINNTESPIRVKKNHYEEILKDYKWAFDVASESRFDDFSNILIEGKSIMILHLKK